jgi:hypothetical protein
MALAQLVRKSHSTAAMRFAVLALFFVLFPRPALAALGGDEASVDVDAAQMKGTRTVTTNAKYVVHQIVLPSGTVVREYLSAGRIFAVTWRGPWLPDMSVLLGSSFERYKKASRSHRGSHRPFVVDEPDLVVHSAGHPRAFFGEAHLPALFANGVRVEELQ